MSHAPSPPDAADTPLLWPKEESGDGTPEKEMTPTYGAVNETSLSEEDMDMPKAYFKYKLVALVCSCLLSVGSHYASHMLNALKPTLKEELGISNLQFGLLTSASALINTIVPFFGGLFVDVFGTGWGAVTASTLVMVGEVITACATNIDSFPVMMLGRIVYGLGAGCIVTVQEAILAHWFRGKGLALVIGIQLSISRLSSFLAVGTVQPIIDATGFYGTAFWVSAAMCMFSWLVMLIYIFMLRYVAGQKDDEKLVKKLSEKNHFSWAAMVEFKNTFWVIVLLSFLFGLTWAPFMRISTELIVFRFGSDDAVAAWYASVALAAPIVLNPILGGLIERWGKRTWIINLSAALQIVAFWFSAFSCVNPTVGQVIFSVSLALGPVAMITAIPLLVPLSLTGTALGLYKCASNIGTAIMEPLQGQIQDAFNSYDPVMLLLIIFAVATVVTGFVLTAMSTYAYKGLLDAVGKQRMVLVAYFKALETNSPLQRKTPIANFIWITLMSLSLVASWVLYIYFVVKSTVEGDSAGGTPTPTPTPTITPECTL